MLQEVSKTSDYAPSRTFYLFAVDLTQVVRLLINRCYQVNSLLVYFLGMNVHKCGSREVAAESLRLSVQLLLACPCKDNKLSQRIANLIHVSIYSKCTLFICFDNISSEIVALLKF